MQPTFSTRIHLLGFLMRRLLAVSALLVLGCNGGHIRNVRTKGQPKFSINVSQTRNTTDFLIATALQLGWDGERFANVDYINHSPYVILPPDAPVFIVFLTQDTSSTFENRIKQEKFHYRENRGIADVLPNGGQDFLRPFSIEVSQIDKNAKSCSSAHVKSYALSSADFVVDFEANLIEIAAGCLYKTIETASFKENIVVLRVTASAEASAEIHQNHLQGTPLPIQPTLTPPAPRQNLLMVDPNEYIVFDFVGGLIDELFAGAPPKPIAVYSSKIDTPTFRHLWQWYIVDDDLLKFLHRMSLSNRWQKDKLGYRSTHSTVVAEMTIMPDGLRQRFLPETNELSLQDPCQTAFVGPNYLFEDSYFRFRTLARFVALDNGCQIFLDGQQIHHNLVIFETFTTDTEIYCFQLTKRPDKYCLPPTVAPLPSDFIITKQTSEVKAMIGTK